MILGWTYLSQGLRGCAALFPLLGAMVFPKFVTAKAGVIAAILGPLANIFWFFLGPKGIDPLYPGLIVSALSLIILSMITKDNSVGTKA